MKFFKLLFNHDRIYTPLDPPFLLTVFMDFAFLDGMIFRAGDNLLPRT